MATEITMPALSPTMTHGILARWLVSEGDAVSIGDILGEIETDKTVLELESPQNGIVGRLYCEDGQADIAVGELIVVICKDQQEVDALPSAANKSVPAVTETRSQTTVEVSVEDVSEDVTASVTTTNSARLRISPLAKKLASNANLDVSALLGSGPKGRIIKKDIEKALASISAKDFSSVRSTTDHFASSASDASEYVETKLSGISKVIAQRLQESKQTVPHFYLDVDIELDKLLSVRQEINSARAPQKVSINDFIVSACAKALKQFPAMNVQIDGDVERQYHNVDVCIAVALDDGLITPIVKSADTLTISSLSSEVKGLIIAAKAGKLLPAQYQGGCFTISNLGMYGVKNFKAIVNQPQAAILAVGAGEQRAVVHDGELAVATVMTVSLSCDHRVIDGALGAEFLACLKNLLQNPLAILS